MTKIDSIIRTLSQDLSRSAPQEKYLTCIDLHYARRQLKLYNETARHCNFNLISSDMTRAYRFTRDFMV